MIPQLSNIGSCFIDIQLLATVASIFLLCGWRTGQGGLGLVVDQALAISYPTPIPPVPFCSGMMTTSAVVAVVVVPCR